MSVLESSFRNYTSKVFICDDGKLISDSEELPVQHNPPPPCLLPAPDTPPPLSGYKLTLRGAELNKPGTFRFCTVFTAHELSRFNPRSQSTAGIVLIKRLVSLYYCFTLSRGLLYTFSVSVCAPLFFWMRRFCAILFNLISL